MSEQVFRQKNLDKIRSPESLNDYLRVANPGVWLMLATALLLLVGACVWGVFGHIETTLPTVAAVKDGRAVCHVLSSGGAEKAPEVGMMLRIDDMSCPITAAEYVPEADAFDYLVEADMLLPDGVYEAVIVTESVRPFSFLWN